MEASQGGVKPCQSLSCPHLSTHPVPNKASCPRAKGHQRTSMLPPHGWVHGGHLTPPPLESTQLPLSVSLKPCVHITGTHIPPHPPSHQTHKQVVEQRSKSIELGGKGGGQQSAKKKKNTSRQFNSHAFNIRMWVGGKKTQTKPKKGTCFQKDLVARGTPTCHHVDSHPLHGGEEGAYFPPWGGGGWKKERTCPFFIAFKGDGGCYTPTTVRK